MMVSLSPTTLITVMHTPAPQDAAAPASTPMPRDTGKGKQAVLPVPRDAVRSQRKLAVVPASSRELRPRTPSVAPVAAVVKAVTKPKTKPKPAITSKPSKPSRQLKFIPNAVPRTPAVITHELAYGSADDDLMRLVALQSTRALTDSESETLNLLRMEGFDVPLADAPPTAGPSGTSRDDVYDALALEDAEESADDSDRSPAKRRASSIPLPSPKKPRHAALERPLHDLSPGGRGRFGQMSLYVGRLTK
jgi:hypothetical protein